MAETKPQAQDFIEWDVANWSRALPFWAANSRRLGPGATALEVGSRHGGLSLWLAGQGCQVLCTDVVGPSEQARQRHQRFALADRIAYQPLNILTMDAHQAYDLVALKSVLGGLHQTGGESAERRGVTKLLQALRPGGELLFAENLCGSALHRKARQLAVPWANRWRYLQVAEIPALFAGFSDLRYQCIGFLGAFGRTEWQRRVLGYADRALVEHLVKPHWRYIVIGVARK